MYYIKFKKRERDYIFLYNNKELVKKFLTFHSLYEYIRDNKIDFYNIRFRGLDFYLLFYHFVYEQDLEDWYINSKSLKKKTKLYELLKEYNNYENTKYKY